MRRISVKNAKPGMILSFPIYDSKGQKVVEAETKISPELLRALGMYGIPELIIEDWRVDDVVVQSLISPELEGRTSQALRTIMTECRGSKFIDDTLLEEATNPVFQMAKELFPEVIGEVNSAGCLLLADYPYVQPVKVVGLSLIMGKRIGLSMEELAGLGMAALFKDIGSILIPEGILDKPQPSEGEMNEIRKHPVFGAEVISQLSAFGPEVAEAVFYHHEKWDGSGYPEGLNGTDIPIFARIIAIADTYYELVSERPDRKAIMPHEAIEYVMACVGELFDYELVELFVRQVSVYPTGVTVELSTGEIGIISDGNLGHIARPVVRICFDTKGQPVKDPYDVNLAEAEHQRRMVVQILED